MEAAEPHIRVQVFPFEQGGHDALGGSLTVPTLPDGSEVVYTKGAHYGQLVEEPAEFRRFFGICDRLRADALPTVMSLDMQLQQSGGRQLRGGRRRGHGRRARS